MVSGGSYQQSKDECLVVKPSIKNSLLLLRTFSLSLPLLIFFAIFFGFFSIVNSFIVGEFQIKITGFHVFYVIVILALGSIPFFFQRATLKRTEYRFYADRVEFYEGFLIKHRKTITYDRISNVGQIKGILEGWFGLGTIFLDSPGSSPRGHEVSMSFLENPDKIYDYILKLISKKK